MRNYFTLAALALTMLAGCTNEAFLGNESDNKVQEKPAPIEFGNDVDKNFSRAYTHQESAELLNKLFYIYGTKTVGGTATTVFDNYSLNYEGEESAGTTETNPRGWEYVGYQSKSGATQDVKYWDYSAERYDFVAAAGIGASEQITSTDQGFTVDIASPDKLSGVFFADRVSAKPTAAEATATTPRFEAYQSVITFKFRRLGAKMRVGFYETIPGYAVKNLKFYYVTAAGGSGTVGLGCVFPQAGKYTISYDALNNAQASVDLTADGSKYHKYETFGRLKYTTAESKAGDADKAYILSDGTPSATGDEVFLATTSAQPTWAVGTYAVDGTPNTETAWRTILPYEANNSVMQLRVNYDLVSLDGSKETIHVRNAHATVPVTYTMWKPNYSYTYIFKISDNTNGKTSGASDPNVNPDPDTPDPNPEISDPSDPDNPQPGDPDPSDPVSPDPTDPEDVAGLYPITFDAVAVEESGYQETITTVTEPSITTYSETSAVTTVGEYKVGENIILSCGDATAEAWDYCVSNATLTENDAKANDEAGHFTFTRLATGTTATLTPSQAGWYVVRMQYGTVSGVSKYAYKVIVVK